MSFVKATSDGVVLCIRVVPRSSKNTVDGVLGNALKIRLQAPPVEGKANKALVRFLARTLGCRPADITLLSGDKGRNKRVHIRGITEAQARTALNLQG